MGEAAGRVFLFLQGPHGPFFRRLALALSNTGAGVRRVAFNASDEAEWGGAGPLDRFTGTAESYRRWIAGHLAAHGITDIVLYGDGRAEHALAIAAARKRGITCHCLEEGYLRPGRATYERGGNNGNSPLAAIPLSRMADALGPVAAPAGRPEDRWGDLGAHLWHSALYHGRLLLPSRRYGRPANRRGVPLWRELGHYLGRLAGLPLRRAAQALRLRAIRTDGHAYHLVLLQLSFDASMQVHSPYRGSAAFIRDVMAAFARGAPPDTRLVFKSHPFEDGRERLGRVIEREARRLGLGGRVDFLDGGTGLGALLDGALSAVTVNSTAAQGALWRGLPVAALGRAVYARPGLVSRQPLAAFFADPRPPNRQAYWVFRRFLEETSQLPGSFYAQRGIATLLETLPSALLAPEHPYERLPGASREPDPCAADPPGGTVPRPLDSLPRAIPALPPRSQPVAI